VRKGAAEKGGKEVTQRLIEHIKISARTLSTLFSAAKKIFCFVSKVH
jgi:hypothetical protein